MVVIAIRVGDRRARELAEEVARRDAVRLVALRAIADAHNGHLSAHPDLLDEPMPDREEDEPEMIFCAVTEDGVREVEVYLDERMLGDIRHNEVWAWQGVIEYVEDEIKHNGA